MMATVIFGDVENRIVKINGIELDPKPSQKLINHSPDGFMWGYGGSGPSQLALALLLHFYGNAVAYKHYMKFKDQVIAQLPMDSDFELAKDKIDQWLKTQKVEAR